MKKLSLLKISDLFLQSWQIFKKIFFRVLLVNLLALGLFFSFEYFFGWLEIDLGVNIILLRVFYLLGIFSLSVLFLWGQLVIFYWILYPEKKFSLVFLESKSKLGKFLIFFLFFSALIYSGIFPKMILSILFFVLYNFAVWVLIVENLGVFSSFSRSYQLVKSYFWEIFIRLFLAFLGVILFFVLVYFLNLLVVNFPKSLLIIYNLIIEVGLMMIPIFIMIISSLIYKNLQKIKESEPFIIKNFWLPLIFSLLGIIIFVLVNLIEVITPIDPNSEKVLTALALKNIILTYLVETGSYPLTLNSLPEVKGLNLNDFSYKLTDKGYEICFDLEKQIDEAGKLWKIGRNCINAQE